MNAVKHYTDQADTYALLAALAGNAVYDPNDRVRELALMKAWDLAQKEEASYRDAAKAAAAALAEPTA